MARATGKVCVIGADGYLGSWVVKHLISNNYTVHDTVRQPDSWNAKYAHLNQLERANVLDYDSICSAIASCIGVFHVASPVPSTIVPNPQEEVIEPAVKGTLNVLKACVESNVKRVVVVSAVSLNTRWPVGQIKDEACRSDKEYCAATKNWYCLSKTEAEIEAFEFAKRSGLDVITSTINASSKVLFNLLKEGYDSLENKLQKIVDVRDIAQALLLVYEKNLYVTSSSLLYMAWDFSCMIFFFVILNHLCNGSFSEGGEEDTISSEKLQRLGWSYRPLEETLVDSIESYKKAGILD
ncbi:hypothetical protein GOBAR_AA19427 [Gossypium barbadense]|uniref:NAD-dependent epimerase/dehydratase domain-containing protein n=1 Tax=Gossypium barbadense TaxID=3634 RepID=A0A2P5XD10_GOSBA|nr:hypothetical protein GOBAR_AA19427 [Gossypium barbadense]